MTELNQLVHPSWIAAHNHCKRITALDNCTWLELSHSLGLFQMPLKTSTRVMKNTEYIKLPISTCILAYHKTSLTSLAVWLNWGMKLCETSHNKIQFPQTLTTAFPPSSLLHFGNDKKNGILKKPVLCL